ncbi:MAG: hypothetical protein R3D01_01435 [Hyphomicrobiales bacterium]
MFTGQISKGFQYEGAAPSRSFCTSDTGYFLCAVVCLSALLVLRLVAVHVAANDFVMDEAQYWTWSRDLDFGYFSKPPLIA